MVGEGVAENAFSSMFSKETSLYRDYFFKILSDGSEFHHFEERNQFPFHHLVFPLT